jgi:hypothetical protein
LGGLVMALVEHLERDHPVRSRGMVSPVNRGRSAVANDTVDHVILEPIRGHQHALRLRSGGVLHAARAGVE